MPLALFGTQDTQDTLALRTAPTWTNDKEPTKRLVLSHIARIFDPAGWAAPVIVAAKILGHMEGGVGMGSITSRAATFPIATTSGRHA